MWQINGKHAQQIDEIFLEDPRNKVKDVCDEFKTRYPWGKVSGLFLYGDRKSVKEDTRLEKGENFFSEIEKHLKAYGHSYVCRAETHRWPSLETSLTRSMMEPATLV